MIMKRIWMKYSRLVVAALLVTAFAVTGSAAENSKFRPASDRVPAVGRYLVELAGDPANAEATIGALVRAYGVRTEPFAREGFHGALIVTTPARARTLSNDPRVVAVIEQAESALGDVLPAAPPPAATAVAVQSVVSSAVPAAIRLAAPRADWTHESKLWTSGAYAYDGAGNIKQIGDDVYRYDGVNRLVHATSRTPGHPANAQDFAYDRYGNITRIATRSDAHAPRIDDFAVAPDTNQLTNASVCAADADVCHSRSYDAAGNQTGASSPDQFKFDALGMVTEFQGLQRRAFIYDANDERIATVQFIGNQEVTRRYTLRGADNKVLRELSYDVTAGTWSFGKDYVYRGGTLLASFTDPSPTAAPDRHYHVDHLGSPRLITDGAGFKVAAMTFAPFGREAAGSEVNAETLAARMKFTGHERDTTGLTDDLPLDYMHARYYDPALGRFLSVDPASDSVWLAFTQSWNRYSYALNNPISVSDPTGLKPCKVKVTGADAEAAGVDDGTEIEGVCVEAEADKPKRDKTTPWQVGWEWLTGTGERSREFHDGDKFTERLKQHAFVEDLVNDVCGGERAPEGRATHSLGGLKGVPTYLRDASTLATGGLTGNIAATYLGSYNVQYGLANGSVHMVVKNDSSVASGFRPPVIGYTPWWHRNVGSRVNNAFSTGAMSKTTQTFYFSKPCS